MTTVTNFALSTILGLTAGFFATSIVKRFTDQETPEIITFSISVIIAIVISIVLRLTILPLPQTIDTTTETTSNLVQEMLNK